MDHDCVLVTGATGYIGGRLVPRLVSRGFHVRVIVRDARRLKARTWSDSVEIVEGDIGDEAAMSRAMEGVRTAFYLVHSMGDVAEFRDRDRRLALGFGAVAGQASLERIIYLGGLGDPQRARSTHLVSRREVGEALSSAGVPVVEFRAALIVGSGSASFEMLRHLTERVPVMIAPRWVETKCQPIGIRSVLEYLIEALERPTAEGIYEIGGPEVLTYREMILTYAQLRGLRRVVWALDVPHPEWSSRFLSTVTPIPHVIAAPLIGSLQYEMTVKDERALAEFAVTPMGFSEAVSLALDRVAAEEVETTWASSLASTSHLQLHERELAEHDGLLFERHRRVSGASPDRVFASICALGGDEGWPVGNWLWQLRGLIDRAIGGVGMRRGRRHPRSLLVGEPVDFWRVEALERDHLVRLRAEMRLPGRAWLQFEVRPDERGSRVEQTAFFEPHGLLGHLYWFALLPFHRFLFPGLIRAVCDRAERPELPGDRPVRVAFVRRRGDPPLVAAPSTPRPRRAL